MKERNAKKKNNGAEAREIEKRLTVKKGRKGEEITEEER